MNTYIQHATLKNEKQKTKNKKRNFQLRMHESMSKNIKRCFLLINS